jgi:hypothetical protein
MLLNMRRSALCLLLFASCRQAAPEQAVVIVRDSGGIQIVENASPAWAEGEGWQLSQSLVIGEVDGDEDYLLNRVSGAIRMPDGRIVIANSRAAELRVYDASGKHLRRVGRKGAGPGEFERIEYLLRLAGDTVVVWDAAGPVNFFDDKLRYIRREPVNHRRLLDLLGWDKATESQTPLPDGSLVIHLLKRGSSQSIPEGKVYRPPIGYYRVARDLSRVDSLGWYGGLPQMYLNIGGRRVVSTASPPAHADVTGGGDPLQIYAGNGDVYEIDAYNADGRRTRIIRRTNALVPLPPDFEEQSRKSRDKDARRVRDAMPVQTHYPAYWQLYADADANLWVGRLGAGTDIFDRNGRWLGTRSIRGELLEIGRDHVLVLRQDSLGVEQVVLYNLRRS